MKIYKYIQSVILFTLFLTLLSGCMHPNERRLENQVPNETQMEMVQLAVLKYKEKTGVLPIQTKESDTPIFEKYVIDFQQLLNHQLIPSIPSHSFEAGGLFQYVLVDVESEKPMVKLIDLRIARKIGELQLRVNDYLRENTYLPVAEIVDGEYYRLDYKKLNLKKAPEIPSPYSQTYLPIIANREGKLAVDYRLDLYQTLQEIDPNSLDPEKDLREILLSKSVFVPAYSFPYTIKDGEPVLRKFSN